MSVYDVFRALWLSPRKLLLDRWNWKSALFSSLIRALLFFFCNLKAGWMAASGSMLAEFVYRAATAGFYGALTQAFRKARPAWAANLAVVFLLTFSSHALELVIHSLRHTPKLVTSIVTSICFTVISTLFNLYAMRRGALIVGEDSRSAVDDLRRMPALIGGFVASGPMQLYRIVNRCVTRPSNAARDVVSGCLLLFLLLPLQAEEIAKPTVREYHASALVSTGCEYRQRAFYCTLLKISRAARAR